MDPIQWKHQDTAPGDSIRWALEMATSKTWAKASAEDGPRFLRALMLATLDGAETLSRREPYFVEGTRLLGSVNSSSLFNSPDRVWVAGALQRTPQLLLPRGLKLCSSFESIDGGQGTTSGAPVSQDTGALPAIAIVVIAAAATAAIVYIAQQAATVIDRALARQEDSQRMVQAHAEVLKVNDAHLAAEKAAGKTLPLSEAERAAVQALVGVQQQIAGRQERPMPEPFPGANEFLRDLGKTATSILPLALLAGGAVLVMKA
jgi:hypothetical protein